MARFREAAAVLVTRGAGRDLEVLLVERRRRLRFFGGWFALPGGTVDREDVSAAACAARELAEEIGVAFAPEELEELCTLTTPEFAPVRYPTRFFRARLPAGACVRLQTSELASFRFERPAAALAAWRRGELPIVPPVLFLLDELNRGEKGFAERVARAAAAFARGRLHPVFFTPGILLAPLRTATLPPAVATNCFLVGVERLFVVDPGACEPAELERLYERIEIHRAAGAEPVGVLLTHGHADHTGGAVPVAERYAVPVHAHPLTLQFLPDAVPKVAVTDGDRIPLGAAPDGRPDWQLIALETPGHEPGHLVFFDDRYFSLLAGDLVATLSTVVIDPDDGDMAAYLASLERALQLAPQTVHPAHGGSELFGRDLLERFLAHRRAREERLLAALGPKPRPARDLLPEVYADVEPGLHAFALRSLLSGLRKLTEEGRAIREGRGWRLPPGREAPAGPASQ